MTLGLGDTDLATQHGVGDGVGQDDPATGLYGLERHHDGLTGLSRYGDHLIGETSGLEQRHRLGQHLGGQVGLDLPVPRGGGGRGGRGGGGGGGDRGHLDVLVLGEVDGRIRDHWLDGGHLPHLLLLLLIMLAAGVAVLLVSHGDVRQEVEVVEG